MKRENVVFAVGAWVVLWLAGVPFFLVSMAGEHGSYAAVFELLAGGAPWSWLLLAALMPFMGVAMLAILFLPFYVFSAPWHKRWGWRTGPGYGGR